MAQATRPRELTVSYARDPIGIDERRPRLGWRAAVDERGDGQTAFRVLVATESDRLTPAAADVWDSGWRQSDRPAVRYDGPALASKTRYHWTVRIRDGGEPGPWAEPATFETGLLEPEDWTVAWIRRPSGTFERGQFSYFRREIDLDGDIRRARAYVSASHAYELSINGERVDRGPALSYPDYQYYRTVALEEYLSAGANAIGVLHNWNGEGQGRPPAEPGLVVQLEITLEDGRERVVTTDGDWRVREGAWLDTDRRNGEIAEPIEVMDLREIPDGWDEPGFDDSDWETAERVGVHPTEPWERLLGQNRDLNRREIAPVDVDRVAEDTYVFDFGRVYAGVPKIEFAEGTAGDRVAIRAGFRRQADGTVDDAEGTQWTDMSFGCVQRDGEQTYRPFNYLGFRYLQVEQAGEELDAGQVSLIARHNAVPDREAATFESSEETVDAVFDLARHSARYGSQGQFIDTPTREKGQFLMDGLNISRTTTRAFGERRLSRGAIREFVRSHYRYWAPEGRLNAIYPNGDGKRDIPDFTAAFPEWVWRYYAVADDRAILEETYPVVRAVADYVIEHVGETGLIERLSGGEGGPYHEGIVDWPPEMRYGYDREWSARTTVNVVCANALDRAATIAESLDRPDAEIDYYRHHRETIVDAVDEHLRDGAQYVDGGDGERASEHASQHANALPLATGIVPETVEDAVADRVVEKGMAMGPMMVPWLLEALDRADRPAAMVDILTDSEADGWSNILEAGGTFTWETWHCRDPEMDAHERQNRSESHAMGATVLEYIQRTLLGVDVVAPGGSEITVEPPASGLEHATGTVPTERGTVAVAWERDSGGFELDLTVPWHTTATVRLPAEEPADATVTEEGREIDPGDLPAGIERIQRADDAVVVTVAAGEYAFDVIGCSN